MSEEEKDKLPAVGGEGTSDAGDSATDTEGKIVKIDQFLDVFEVKKRDSAYEMNVNRYLLDQLRDEGITHEEYVKKIKSAQKFISNCYAEKDGEKKMWNGISSGGETPTLTPSSGSDMEIAEFFYYMQTYNCYRNIARAFDVKEDEKGKLFFESREGASVDSLIKAGNSFLKLGWRPDSFYKEEVGGKYTSKPLTTREKNLVNSDFFTPMDIVLQAFDIETDEKGNAVSIKSKEDATEEDIGVGKIALEKLKWSEDLDEERVKDASGKEHYSVSCTPIFTENKVILEMLLAYKEKKNKEYAVIEGKGGNTATIEGGKTDEAGNVTGAGEEDKQKKGKLRVGTGYGEGSDIFADRVSEAKKLLSELMTPNSETMADFFIDLCVNVTAKIKDDMLLIYQRKLAALISDKGEIAKALREFAFGDEKNNGAINTLTEQIKKGDMDSAKETLNKLTGLVDLTLKSDVDKRLAGRSLKEIGKTLSKNESALRSGAISGDTLIKQLAPAFADLKVAVSNKRRIMRSQPTAGHGAHTP